MSRKLSRKEKCYLTLEKCGNEENLVKYKEIKTKKKVAVRSDIENVLRGI